MNSKELVKQENVTVQEIIISRPPEAVLEEARKAATALKDIISKKLNPIVINNEQYLEFEDWQTVGRFYGLTVRVESTNFLQVNDTTGYEASAIVMDIRSGNIVSRAEAMCLRDETKWSAKPLFQLRSMAQTRACAKAFRNVLAWVVVLAGYRPTPAEEMQMQSEKEQDIISDSETKGPREEIRQMILEMTEGNEAEAKKMLEEFTSFVPKGKTEADRVRGKLHVKDLTEKQITLTYGKVKEAYEQRQKNKASVSETPMTQTVADYIVLLQYASTPDELHNIFQKVINADIQGEDFTMLMKERDKKATAMKGGL